MLNYIKNRFNYKSNIFKLNLYCFFNSLIFAYVIERLFSLERNISIQQMVYLEIIYAFSIMVLEVPTGMISDKSSRKKVMVFSTVFDFFEFFILIFSYSFWGFALHSIVASVSGALSSGTLNSMYYETLKEENKSHEFEKYLGFATLCSSIGGCIAALLGSLLAEKYGYTFNYWLSLISVIGSFLCTLSLKDTHKIEEIALEGENNNEFKLKDVFSFFKVNSSIIHVSFVVVMLTASVTYIDEYWQIYFKEIQIPVFLFGFFSLFREIFISFSSLIAYKVKAKFEYKYIFGFSAMSSGLLILLASFYKSYLGIVFIAIVFIFFELNEILSFGYIHNKAESKYRATIESFNSMILRFFTIVIGLCFGYFATETSIFQGFSFLSIFILFYCIIYFCYSFNKIEN